MFEQAKEELFEKLGDHQLMVLATGARDRITARTMSVVVMNGRLYFQTGNTLLKYEQIMENPQAAICFSNVSLEGACRVLGHPMEEKNAFFTEKYRERFRGSFEAYSKMETEVLIEFTPKKAAVWDYDNGKPYRKFIDFERQTVQVEYYGL